MSTSVGTAHGHYTCTPPHHCPQRQRCRRPPPRQQSRLLCRAVAGTRLVMRRFRPCQSGAFVQRECRSRADLPTLTRRRQARRARTFSPLDPPPFFSLFFAVLLVRLAFLPSSLVFRSRYINTGIAIVIIVVSLFCCCLELRGPVALSTRMYQYTLLYSVLF